MVNSEGNSPSIIKNKLLEIGFKPTKGNYDFVYDWKNESVNVEELLWFADKIHKTLKNMDVLFNIETI